MTIRATFENGVFRPNERVELPEHAQVELEARVISAAPEKPSLDRIHQLLGERFDSGDRQVSARHDEHQP